MIPHLGQSNIVTASYSTFQLFLVILGGQNGPQGGLKGVGEIFFAKKMCFIQTIQMIPHLAQSDIVMASYSTFWHFGHFWSFLGVKMAPRGVWGGRVKNFFWQKDVFYLDNSNDTSFSSIGHRGGKLFNFLTFFGHFGGQKSAPEPNEITNKI